MTQRAVHAVRAATWGIALPVIVLPIQWAVWPWISPYAWLLYFPATYASARLGGRVGGLAATLVSTLIIWFVFLPPYWSWDLSEPAHAIASAMFLFMGWLISGSQQRLHDALARIEDQSAAIFEQAAVGMGVVDPNGRWLKANNKLCDMLGYDRGELLGKTFQAITHPGDLATDLDWLEKLLSREIDHYAIEKRYIRKDGSEIWINLTVSAAWKNATEPDYFIGVIEDIHAKKLAEERLALWGKVFEVADFALAITDPSNNSIVAVNPAFARQHGYRPDGMKGKPILSLFPEDCAPEVWRFIAELNRDGHGVFESEHLRKNGERYPVLHDITVLKDIGGLPKVRLAYVQDLTERKQLEAQRRLWSDAFDNCAHGIAIGDPATGRIRACNPALLRILDQPLEQIVDHPILDVYAPEARQTVADCIASADQHGHVTYESRMIRGDGAGIDVQMDLVSVRDDAGLLRYRVATLQDITARKNAERALRESEERMRLFVEHAPVAIAMFDREMIYLAVSQRWLSDYGLNTLSTIGRCHYDLFPTIPERWVTVHRRGLAGELIREDSDRFERADGSVQWIRWEVRPWYRNDGQIGGIVIFAEDITSIKRAEEQIQQLNADLEQRVQARTAELVAANHELESFAYAVSHDLRAPLRAMSGFSRALREDFGDQLTGDALTYLGNIEIGARRMDQLINGILTLSRSTRGGLDIHPVNLSELAERRLKQLQVENPERRVVTSVETGLVVQGDERMLDDALCNLLENAWKYSANSQPAEIRFFHRDQDGVRFYCVADNGAGFDMTHSKRLFEPFQRLHRQDEFPGLGIGLATVQRIIHRHGGTLEASGTPGKGAEFRFSLGVQATLNASCGAVCPEQQAPNPDSHRPETTMCQQ